MQRWGVLYHSEALGLYLQKAGWVGFCMAFKQKGQAASLLQKLYQSPLLSEAARSFVLNHVGAIVNTYVVTALERHRFNEHRRCVEAQELGIKLDQMERWDMFEDDLSTDDEEREVVNPFHPSRREKRSPSPGRFGGIFRSYQGYSPIVRQSRGRWNFGAAVRPRTNIGTRPRPVVINNRVGPKPPHIQTVQTKGGKQVDVNNNQAYVSAKIPTGAIPLQAKNGQTAGSMGSGSPLASPPKVQSSSKPWGMPSSVLPGSSAGKSAGLPKSKSSPDLTSGSAKSITSKDTNAAPSLKRVATEGSNLKSKGNQKSQDQVLKSSGHQKSGAATIKGSTYKDSGRMLSGDTRVRQYLQTKAFIHKRQQVVKAYGIKAP